MLWRAAVPVWRPLALAAFYLAASAPAPSFAANPPAAPAFNLDHWCRQVTPRLPRISHAQCVKSALAPTGAVSARKVPIASRRFAAPGRSGKPLSSKPLSSKPLSSKPLSSKPLNILLVGGIHGDELTSSAVVFEWIQMQAAQPRQDVHWHMVPLLNPDGMLARPATRVNANGVDLNRNFPTPGWQQEAPAWWIHKTRRDPRRYPGRAPLSEPESRWLHQEIERSKPDLVVAVHAPYKLLDFDGPAPAPERFGNLRIERVGVFPGSLGNYGGYQKKVPVITIELPNARQMPSIEESRRIWEDMQRWIALKLTTRVSQ